MTEKFSETSEKFQVKNPATGRLVDYAPLFGPAYVEASVESAYSVFPDWAATDPVLRSKILFNAAKIVRQRQEILSKLLTSEQGKPLYEALNEIQGFAHVIEYYASVAGSLKGGYFSSPAYGHSIIAKKPLGVCGAIIPWNMPVLIMGWKVGPALVTGNTVVIKPASTAPLTCMKLADIFFEAGLPKGVLNVITGPGSDVGEAIVTHPKVRSVSFTGEIKTGKRVATLAAPYFKRVTLELGGNDPMIVCSDADPEKVLKGVVRGRFFNCGQICTAVKRLILMQDIADKLIPKLAERISKLNIGNGLSPDVNIGPLNNQQQRDSVANMVFETVDKGLGKVITGGKIPDSPDLLDGFFYEPTLITEVSHDADIVNKELFGPVLPVILADNLRDAVEIANITDYGLGASVWTQNLSNINYACESLDAGIVWVNQHVKIPPEVPFGGMKQSGLGRENGPNALDRYLVEKSVLIKTT